MTNFPSWFSGSVANAVNAYLPMQVTFMKITGAVVAVLDSHGVIGQVYPENGKAVLSIASNGQKAYKEFALA